MAWVRVDDHFDEHPKFAKAGPLGIALWLAGLAYCNRNLTDGFIPWVKARALLSWEFLGPETRGEGEHKIYSVGVSSGMAGDDVSADFVIAQLVYADLWDEVDGGYVVHDYLDYQPSKDDVQKERSRNAERQARHRNTGDNAVSNAGSNGVTDSVTDSVNNSVSAPGPVPKPVPGTKPKPERRSPSAPNGASPPRGRARRQTEVTDELCQLMEDEFWEAFGSRQAVRDVIDHAMGHKARLKCTDQRAYLRNWVRDDAEKAAVRRNGRGGLSLVSEHSGQSVWPLCACGEKAHPAEFADWGKCRDCHRKERGA